jgi:hypothetical protein
MDGKLRFEWWLDNKCNIVWFRVCCHMFICDPGTRHKALSGNTGLTGKIGGQQLSWVQLW